ncbi:MAG TPA: hypothetical protein VG964_01155 [Candidatus Saccharimonadales bacterium]|nr:hypothetical protein [Candidatus Saccharimonadales bacterium]
MEYGSISGGMGGGLGGFVGGLGGTIGGGTTVALLPNTGGSLRVLTIAAILSIITGLAVLLSSLARFLVLRGMKNA